MAKKGKGGTASRAAVWTILVLLIVGLAGFGAVNFGGTIRSIGTVGETEIDTQRYARALSDQMRAFSAQTGQNMTLAQAQMFGLDRAVLGQLVGAAALEEEARRLGLSVGDTEVRDAVLQNPSFRGLDGSFDREAYRFMLEQSGLNESQFEEQLRAELARTLLAGAVASGVTAPDAHLQTVMDFLGERRSFDWAVVTELDTPPLPAPSDTDLRAHYDANEAEFTLPETRRITYAWVTPSMIVDTVEVDEDGLRALYEDRIDEFVRPERRIVERLIVGNAEAAAEAKARLDAGEVTFENLVAERGLDLTDVDLGDVTRDDLDAAGDAVFALEEPGIAGPIQTPLGSALFRVNAILSAQETPFEDARDALIDEYALDRAVRVIDDLRDQVDDLLAGGATLEELATETEMELGQIDWFPGADGEEIAGYQGFQAAARAVQPGDFPEALELDDGGLFALRLDEIVEPRLQPFDEVRDAVEESWRTRALSEAMEARAEELRAELEAGGDPAELGLTLTTETELTRDRRVPDTPTGFMDAVFAMELGDWAVVPGETAAYLVNLTEVQGPDLSDDRIAAQRERLEAELSQSIASDILQAYTAAVELRAGVALNQAAINAVHAQFP